jgi:predicted ATP-dependent endonuclease of OLD family
MSYIGRCQLSGYKSIKNVSCEFNKGLNIIIGNNGSGKTNLLEFIDKLLRRDYSGLDVFNGSLEIHEEQSFVWRVIGKIEESGKLGTPVIKITESEKEKIIYIGFARFSIPNNLPVIGNELNPRYNFSEKRLIYEDDLLLMPFIVRMAVFVLFEQFLNIKDRKKLTDEVVFNTINDVFNNFLWPDLKKNLLSYTPIEDIRVSNAIRVTPIDSSIIEFRNIVFEYKVADQWFPWSALSDGTRRLVYIICIAQGLPTALESEKDIDFIPIVLVEEPEVGVHPHQLHSIMNFLKEKAEKQQIIITTHSPQVLDVLGADELDRIFISEIDYENGTTIRKLTERETEKAKLYLQDEGMLSDYWRFSDFQRSKASK